MGIRISRWLSVVLAVATLGLVVWMIMRDRPSLDALGDIDPLDVTVIMVLQVLHLVPESYRQKIVIESSASTSIRWYPFFRIFVVGRFLNTLIPQSGNVYRALRLRSEFSIAIADFGGGMIAFVVMSFVASMLAAAPFIALQSPSLTIGGVPAALAFVVIGCVVGVAPFVIWFVGRSLPAGWRGQSRLLDIANQVVTATITALRNTRLMLTFLGVWGLTLSIVVVLYRTVFSMVGWELGIGEAIAIYALLQASTFIVLTPGNVGIQELGLAAFATIFGIPAAIGAIAAALIRVTGWIAIAIPAAVFGSADIVQFLHHRETGE